MRHKMLHSLDDVRDEGSQAALYQEEVKDTRKNKERSRCITKHYTHLVT